MSDTLELRHAYPGVPPWEWDARPLETARVLCALRAVEAARRMLQQQHDEQIAS